MTDAVRMIVADHPKRGALFAAVDPAARYVTGGVAEMRFAALLTPFTSVAEAEEALTEAGVSLPGGAK